MKLVDKVYQRWYALYINKEGSKHIMEQLDLFATTATTTTVKPKKKRVTRKRTKKDKPVKEVVITTKVSQDILDEEDKIKEHLTHVKPFEALGGSVSWFRSNGYTWYCNAVERPQRAVRGLESVLHVSGDELCKLIDNDKVMIGLAKGTYLVYYKTKKGK